MSPYRKNHRMGMPRVPFRVRVMVKVRRGKVKGED